MVGLFWLYKKLIPYLFNKMVLMVSHRISFDEEQLDFIREYKENSGLDIQKFVRSAVEEKIEKIKVEEALDSLNRLKK